MPLQSRFRLSPGRTTEAAERRRMTRAEELFERICTGRHNALKRPKNSYDDRALRELINKANRSGTDCIINNGKGYYRPDLKSETELHEVNIYLCKELNRCRDLGRKYKQMKLHIKNSMDRLEFEHWFEKKKREAENAEPDN